MKRHKVFATLVVLGIVGLIAGAIVIAQQQITLTSYYPAPYGEYVDLTFAGHLDAKGLAVAPPLSNAGEGRIYFDNTAGVNKFKASENGQPYADLGGGGGPWTRNTGGAPATLYPTDPTDVVGIGTTTPDPAYQLDVVGDVFISNPAGTGYSVLRMKGKFGEHIRFGDEETGEFWTIISDASGFHIKRYEDGFSDWQMYDYIFIEHAVPPYVRPVTPMLQFDSAGNAKMSGDLYVAGTISVRDDPNCCADYVFQPDYPLESIEDHSAYMWENRHLKGIPGPEAGEEGKTKINVLKTQMGMLEELEKAHLYIEQLHKRLKALEEKVAETSGPVLKETK